MSSSSCEWDACVRLLSSDRAVLDVLLRGARRRYEGVCEGLDHTQRAAAWSEAVRDVVVTAFADDGVVRLLTDKMQLCKAASQRAPTRTKPSERRAYSGSKGAAAAAGEVAAGKALATPPPSAAKNTHRSSMGTVRNNMDESEAGGEWLESSSAKLLEQKNAQALPCCCSCGRDAGASRAKQRSSTLLSRAVMPIFMTSSNTERAVPIPVEHGRNHKDVDGCARTAGREDGRGGGGQDIGGLDYQKMPEPIRLDASRGNDRGNHVFADAAAKGNDEEDGNHQGDAPPLVVASKDHHGRLCYGLEGDDGLGTSAVDRNNISDFDSPCNGPSALGEDPAAVPSSLNEELPPLFSSRGHHRQSGSRNDPPATTASTGTTTEGMIAVSTITTGLTTPPSPVGVVKSQSLTRGDTSTAPTRNSSSSSRAGVLVEGQPAAVEESEKFKVAACVAAPGLPMSSFQLPLECGAALDRGYEQASNPIVAQKDNDDEPGFDGGHSQSEGGNADISTTVSVCEEKFTGTEGSDFSTDVDGWSARKEVTELEPGRTEAIFGGKSEEDGVEAEIIILPEATASAVVEKSGWEQEGTGIDAEVGGILSGKAIAVPAEGAGFCSRSLPALGEQKSSPNTSTIEDGDTEDYEFTFDDDELDAGQKMVRFTDESLWSVHEVRASFEQHELGELFYTTDELDGMLEEAELEEALARSKARGLQEEDNSDDGVQKKGVGVGAVLAGLENVSFESLSFDGEDSDYHF